MMSIVRHLQITGRVQGVGFRYAMQRKASELDITGWVRNRHDGSVEAMIQGRPAAVETMTAWAKHGPSGAAVGDVRTAEASGEFSVFLALPTA
ncbi:MAG: acylphosphatase [Burkholderiales bacterium]|nr:acylphosphatase [Burkholderiales bacterium]